jgi:hypothetical protein
LETVVATNTFFAIIQKKFFKIVTSKYVIVFDSVLSDMLFFQLQFNHSGKVSVTGRFIGKRTSRQPWLKFSLNNNFLNVVYHEKQGGSASWRLLSNGLSLFQSTYFFLLNMLFSFKKHISFSDHNGQKIGLFFKK